MTEKFPILLDLPMPIHTQRLMIRPAMPGDGKQMFEAIEESRAQFKRWLPWVDKVNSWEDSEKTSREFYADFILRKSLDLVIFHEDLLIGMCGFNGFDWQVRSSPIGYWCRKSAQGQGFIREAVAALTLYGFNVINLKRITILCNDENERSRQVAESLGFELETRGKGIIPNVISDELTVGRRYVRFDAAGLEAWQARYGE